MSTFKYGLVTRSDFDGLVRAVLLKKMDIIDDILFVHPKDVQDGKISITGRDITTNLPYDARCFLCFDHHASEVVRRCMELPDNQILDPYCREHDVDEILALPDVNERVELFRSHRFKAEE